jgi:AcrR family transcriptional regulator
LSAKERRDREKERRRSQIVDAARAVLFRDGMGAVSMKSIADEAELSVGALYLYFPSKEDLFAALQEEGLDLLHEMIAAAALTEGDASTRLHAMALAYLAFSEQHRNYFDIYNYFLSSPEVTFPAPLKKRIDEHGDRILSVVGGVLTEATGDPAAARRRALVFWATLHGMLQLRKLRETILAGEDFRELYLHSVDCLLVSAQR